MCQFIVNLPWKRMMHKLKQASQIKGKFHQSFNQKIK